MVAAAKESIFMSMRECRSNHKWQYSALAGLVALLLIAFYRLSDRDIETNKALSTQEKTCLEKSTQNIADIKNMQVTLNEIKAQNNTILIKIDQLQLRK